MSAASDNRGRKAAPPRVAKAIQERLRNFLQREYGSVYNFIEGYPRLGAESHLSRESRKRPPFSRKTVQGWLRGTRIPDSASVIKLAEVTQLNPQCLLLGEGDQYRGVSSPPRELGQALHEKIDAELRADGLTPLDIEQFLPDPDDLLSETVSWYRKRCAVQLSQEQRRYRNLTLEEARQHQLELLDWIRVLERRGGKEKENELV